MRIDRSAFEKAAITVGVAGGLLAIILVIQVLSGTLLFSNEMACSEGEAPANETYGGSACFTEGIELPEGFTWDDRGNYKIN